LYYSTHANHNLTAVMFPLLLLLLLLLLLQL
jgi:hypothetical protein